MSGDAAVAAALRDIQASPLRPSSRSLGTKRTSDDVESDQPTKWPAPEGAAGGIEQTSTPGN